MGRIPGAKIAGRLSAAAAGALVLLAVPAPVSGQESGDCTEIAVSAVDDISLAATPDAGSLFTHKLELAFETTVTPLRSVPQGNWLRSLGIEGALDYLATGVPQAGDEVPRGEVRFLDDAPTWGAVVAVAPLAPLPP